MNKNLNTTIKVDGLRQAKGLSKSEVAKKAGYPNSSYSYFLECGREDRPINPEHERKFREAIEALPDRIKQKKGKKSA